MTSNTKLSIKLFVGCPINSEVKMNLNQSPTWKQASIAPAGSPDELVEIHFHGKDFIGRYLSSDTITVPELQKHENHVKARLRFYCPAFDIRELNPCIFAQVFIA